MFNYCTTMFEVRDEPLIMLGGGGSGIIEKKKEAEPTPRKKCVRVALSVPRPGDGLLGIP